MCCCVQIAFLDRILQMVAVAKNRVQLVALCCLVIAGTLFVHAVRLSPCACFCGASGIGCLIFCRFCCAVSPVFAAKVEEAEEKVPNLVALNDMTTTVYPIEIVHQTEVLVLEKLSWSLTAVTAVHFLGVFFRMVRTTVGAVVPLPL